MASRLRPLGFDEEEGGVFGREEFLERLLSRC